MKRPLPEIVSPLAAQQILRKGAKKMGPTFQQLKSLEGARNRTCYKIHQHFLVKHKDVDR